MLIDHIVLAVADIEATSTVFECLGFTLTPLSSHEQSPTSNRCIMFGDSYVELLQLPGGPSPDNNYRFFDIALKSFDVEKHAAFLSAKGIKHDEPKSLSRPIVSGLSRSAKAEFRLLTIDRQYFDSPGFFFCQHTTPELIWQPDWVSHKNTAFDFREIIINSDISLEYNASIYDLLFVDSVTRGASDSSVAIDFDHTLVRYQSVPDQPNTRLVINIERNEPLALLSKSNSLLEKIKHGWLARIDKNLHIEFRVIV